MEIKLEINNITHSDLVRLFNYALCEGYYYTASYDNEQFRLIQNNKREGDSFEDHLADMLLNGYSITIIDQKAEGITYGNLKMKYTNEDDGKGYYEITLTDIINGFKNIDAVNDLISFFIDRSSCVVARDLMQYVLFGKLEYWW